MSNQDETKAEAEAHARAQALAVQEAKARHVERKAALKAKKTQARAGALLPEEAPELPALVSDIEESDPQQPRTEVLSDG